MLLSLKSSLDTLIKLIFSSLIISFIGVLQLSVANKNYTTAFNF
jgi:hypothetical protein